jgi:riboflavin kinase/FMN adenylyltransferase
MSPASLPLRFTARAVSGSGRGKGMGTPTVNLRMEDVPAGFAEGIYACRASLDGGPMLAAAMHHGPRPVHRDAPSCEVHLLDETPEHTPEHVTVEAIAFLREVRDFPSEEALVAQIAKDIEDTRRALS